MRKITKYSNLRETRILPEECWIFENKQFVLHSPSKSFPLVSAKYEHVLKRNGIPYKLGKKIGEIQFLEYWNPDYYYETEKTLPLYARSGSRGFSKNYIVTGKTYTEKVPTEETIRAAHNFLQKVESIIEEEERRQKLLDIERRCKDALKDDLAVAIQLEKQEAYILDKEIFFKSKYETIQCIPFYTYYTAYAIVVNVNKIKPRTEISLKVPKGKEALFIGTKGEKIKNLARMLGVKYIKVYS